MASQSQALKARATRADRTDTARRRVRLDGLIVSTSAALVLLGLIMILSASSVASFATYGSSFLFFNKQLLWAAIGVAGFFVFARLDYRRLKGFGYVAYAAVFGLLVLVAIPGVGVTVGGSARWIGLGPVAIQPSEFAKLALVLFAADVFTRKHEDSLQDFTHTLVPLIPAVGVFALLVMMQPDLGTTLLLGAIGIGMLFVAGAPLRYLVPIAAIGGAAATLAAVIDRKSVV